VIKGGTEVGKETDPQFLHAVSLQIVGLAHKGSGVLGCLPGCSSLIPSRINEFHSKWA
jgi:hypothetical protein